ncbi:MAG: EamA family transporter [Candidatus Aenigmarchaeota archaeon]|nr:EamA family transporter [Candidatus Aenigmarchaeota archaeon]
MKTKWWALVLVVACTFFTSSAQIFLKFGSARLPLIFWNWPLFAGLVLYGFGAVLLIVSLKGGDVTVLYPIIATSYVWVNILAIFFLRESMNVMKWAGVFAIMMGICFIGWGSKRNSQNSSSIEAG